jgi:hypothetical protein
MNETPNDPLALLVGMPLRDKKRLWAALTREMMGERPEVWVPVQDESDTPVAFMVPSRYLTIDENAKKPGSFRWAIDLDRSYPWEEGLKWIESAFDSETAKSPPPNPATGKAG